MRATLIGRHTAACYLLNEKGLSMDVVSRILDHATTKITRHYAKLMDETVLEAVERADMLASSYSTLPGTKKALFVPGGMLEHASGNDFAGFCSQRKTLNDSTDSAVKVRRLYLPAVLEMPSKVHTPN